MYPEHKQRFEDNKKLIRQFLKTRIKGATVSGGKGTASAWLRITAPGGLSVTEADGLRAVGLIARPGDVFIDVSPKETREFVHKINMVSSPPRLSERISKTEKKPSLGKKRVNVYAEDRKKILGTVSASATSIGAAKVANSPGAYRARINGEYGWVSKDPKRKAPTTGNLVAGKQVGFGGKRKNRFN